MPVSSRTVYGRSFRVTPLWAWAVQRLSAVLLGPLVAVHIWWPGLARNPLLDALLVTIVAGHGYSGITRLAPGQRWSTILMFAAGTWLAVVLVFGILIVGAP
jgi:hypothetical protein